MPSLVQSKTGVFYIVHSSKGKRIWRSLRTKKRSEAYHRFVNYKTEAEPTETFSILKAQEEYFQYIRTNLSPKTCKVYKNIFARFNQFFGDRQVKSITPRDLESYKAARRRTVSALTVNHELRGIRAFFNRLKIWGLVDSNPCDGVSDIRVGETVPPYLEKEDFVKLLSHTHGTQLHDIILFAVMTGLRRGEIFGLTWKDVDFARKTIIIHSNGAYNTKGGKIRVIPMNLTTEEVLRRLDNSTRFVFQGRRGGMNNGHMIRAKFKQAVRKCGLDPRLHFHSLRHTFASWLVKEGVSLYHVQKLMGHSSPRVTQIYAHLGGSELMSSISRIDFAL